MNVERIHEEWSTVYRTSRRGKAHLYEGCQYVKDNDAEPESIEKFPPGHLEFCTDCKTYFKKWLEGGKGNEEQCERCGRKDVPNKYCMSCYSRIRHKKAKKRL